MTFRTTIEKFVTTLNAYHHHHPTYRRGQCVMNVLYSLYPDLYTRACAEGMDVFHSTDDNEITAMLQWMEHRLRE